MSTKPQPDFQNGDVFLTFIVPLLTGLPEYALIEAQEHIAAEIAERLLDHANGEVR